MKRVLTCALALSFFLFTFPVSSVGAIADDESDASFWLNYWVEEHTGIDMTQIPTTAYGMSYADYIYRQTGYTVDYWVDNATNPSQFVDNTNEFLLNSYYNNGEFLKDLLSSTPIADHTAEKYSTSKQDRIDSDGGVNVSGDNYWKSVYNGVYTNDGYKEIYSDSPDGSWNGSAGGYNFTLKYVTVGYYIKGSETTDNPLYNGYDSYSSGGSQKVDIFSFTCNGNVTYVINDVRSDISYYDNIQVYTNSNYPRRLYYSWTAHYTNGYTNDTWTYINLSQNIGSTSSGSEPVLQPKQVGYIYYNGQKRPIYTDPSLNDDLTINPDGTVSDGNGILYDIYLNPDDFNPYGDMYIVQYIINNYYGDPNNPINPFGGNPNGLSINDYDTENGTKTKDYTKAFNSVINWLQKIYNKETEIIKYLKKICNGLPLPNEESESEDENEDKFEDLVSMLSLFNGKNNNGFKQQFLNKIAYSQIQQNIDNFSTALFGSRTFNPDGTVNTSFGSISVTETPELLYTFQGSSHNFWTDLTLLNINGDLTKAKEYVRFFVIFAFFMNLFRSLPSIIKTGQFIAAHSAIPEHESNFVDPDLQSPFEYTQFDNNLIWLDNSYDTVSFDIPDNDDVWFRGG